MQSSRISTSGLEIRSCPESGLMATGWKRKGWRGGGTAVKTQTRHLRSLYQVYSVLQTVSGVSLSDAPSKKIYRSFSRSKLIVITVDTLGGNIHRDEISCMKAKRIVELRRGSNIWIVKRSGIRSITLLCRRRHWSGLTEAWGQTERLVLSWMFSVASANSFCGLDITCQITSSPGGKCAFPGTRRQQSEGRFNSKFRPSPGCPMFTFLKTHWHRLTNLGFGPYPTVDL